MTEYAPPSIPQPGRALVVASALAFAAYLVLLHVLIVSREMPVLTLTMVVAPWIVALGSALLAPRPSAVPVALRALLAIVVLAALVAVLWKYGQPLAARADLMLYLENLVFMMALAAMFAITLRRGREPLITRLARTARNGDMPPSVIRYTRAITAAWALFFIAVAAVSTLLFVTRSLDAWSAFVNLAMWPLVAAMFAVEYAIRRRVLRDVSHVSMMTGVQAFRQSTQLDRLDSGGKAP